VSLENVLFEFRHVDKITLNVPTSWTSPQTIPALRSAETGSRFVLRTLK